MKNLFIFSLMAMLAVPSFVFAAATQTTLEEDIIEAEEYNDGVDQVEVQKMEEEKPEINYQERTRTDRERKALNTGSHASDDH
jgi:hypothetical protein